MTDDLRAAYRTEDAGGTTESAGSVAWQWIEERASEWRRVHPADDLMIETAGAGSCWSVVLYHKTKPVAVATVFRDPMNFAVLVRWVARA